MDIKEKNYELIKFEDGDFNLDVNVSPNDDTVWLTANQMALLFERDEKTIRKHINNVFNEGEADESNTQKMRVPGVDQKVAFYSLNVIISVGYRVKSIRGVYFRKWATSILKEYLLKGYSLNEKRCLSCTSSIISLQNDVNNIKEKLSNIEDSIYKSESLIYEGEILDAYTFLRKLFFLAKDEITIIDKYADKFLLTMLSDLKVKITIVTSSGSCLNKEAIPNNVTIIHNDIIHDRFIVIDDVVYHMGTSINSIGKSRFIMVKLNDITKEMILKKNN